MSLLTDRKLWLDYHQFLIEKLGFTKEAAYAELLTQLSMCKVDREDPDWAKYFTARKEKKNEK